MQAVDRQPSQADKTLHWGMITRARCLLLVFPLHLLGDLLARPLALISTPDGVDSIPLLACVGEVCVVTGEKRCTRCFMD